MVYNPTVNTLVPIQISEAWIWSGITNLIYGEGTATLTTNNGWMTQVNLHNENFPGVLDTVALYVSDECAGVHEMLFISTLIIMTDGVSQRLKFRSIAVMCGIVYVLNIVRLVAFYPIAVESCAIDPDNPSCLMTTPHYEQLLTFIPFKSWLTHIRALESKNNKDKFQFSIRKSWNKVHYGILLLAGLMLISSAYSVTTNDEAMEAKEILDFCAYSSIATNQCMAAQNSWDNAIDTAWSLASIGLIMAASVTIKFNKVEIETLEKEDTESE